MFSGMIQRSGASVGRCDKVSAQWCSRLGLVHTLYRNSENRRRQRATRPCAMSMFSSQRKL